MVERMAKRGLLVAPFLIVALWIGHSPRWGISAAAGIAMTIANLYLSARVIGGVAENSPRLLMPAAIATLMLGLVLLTGIALVLRATNAVDFPVTGLVLVGSHLGLVLWEAAGAYGHVEPSPGGPARVRS